MPEIPVRDGYAHTARLHPICPQPGAHCLREGKDDLAGRIRIRHIHGNCHGIPISLILRPFLQKRGVIPAIGVVPDKLPMLFQMPSHQTAVRCRQIPDGADPKSLQLPAGGAPHPEQVLHRQGPHFLWDFVLKQGVYLVRLLELRCHLGQQLVIRNPDINRESQGTADFRPNLLRKGHRIPPQVLCAVHGAEGLINAVLVDMVGIPAQKLYKGPGALYIQVILRRRYDKPRALVPGFHQGLPGPDAKPGRRSRLGQHDAVAVLFISPYHGRHGAQVQVPALNPDLMGSAPAQERTVDIYVIPQFLHLPFLSILL